MPKAPTTISVAGLAAALLACVSLVTLASPPGAAASDDRAPAAVPRVQILLLPNGIELERIAPREGLAPGLMSAGMGRVIPDQTYLDIGQGARAFNSLYDGPLPLVFPRGRRVAKWQEIRARAASAPDSIRPGLFASTLNGAIARRHGYPGAVRAAPELVVPTLMAADERGRIRRQYEPCATRACHPPVLIRDAQPRQLVRAVQELRGRDLVIAIERPPAEGIEPLAVAVAGSGFGGNLTSDSTRIPGYVLSTDLAPTVLDRMGVEVPHEMTGSPIVSGDGRDLAALAELRSRMSAVGDRRGPVLAMAFLLWCAAVALAALSPSARRPAIRALALAAVLLPAFLLLTAGLKPGPGVERAVVTLGPPAVAVALLGLLPGWRAVAVACGVTVLAHLVDLVAGSPLTALSLMGPNPGLGARFYGIGNELGAALAVLTLLGIGAGLAGFAPRLDRRWAALAFVAVAAPVALVLAAGRFGADVGSAIVIPASAVVAAAVLLARPILAVAALGVPLLGLAALAGIDAASGGGSHFQRAVLEADGPGELVDTAGRRLQLTGRSFVRGASGPILPLTVVVAGLGIAFRDRVREWVGSAPPALAAGFVAAIFASVLGMLANDSGVLLLEVGAAYLLLTTGYAWAQRR